MALEHTLRAWTQFIESLKSRYGDGPALLNAEYYRFTNFARSLPQEDLVPFLLETYDRYRTLCQTERPPYLELAATSILIGTILRVDTPVSEPQALAILRGAYHDCGHGDDVEPPLSMALRFFEHRPYSRDLFDAVDCYRSTLRHVRAMGALNTRRRMIWILWHDPRRVEPRCHSRRIQVALHAMPEPQRLAWHMLLRHNSLAGGASPGKQWRHEAASKLEPIGAADFVNHLDEWFEFPERERVLITSGGFAVLRTLIWCAHLVPDARVLPILNRLRTAHWKENGVTRKLLAALSWAEAHSDQTAHSTSARARPQVSL